MTAAKLERILGWFLGVGFFIFGLIETGLQKSASLLSLLPLGMVDAASVNTVYWL